MARESELLRSFFRDAAARMGEGIIVLVELSEIQRSKREGDEETMLWVTEHLERILRILV